MEGHLVDIVTMGYKKLPRFEQKGNLRVFRIKCLRLKLHVCTWPEMFIYILMALPKVIRLLKKNRYDICHAHFIYPDGIVAFFLKLISGLLYVITAHGSDVPGYNPDRFKIMHKFLKPIGKKIILTSRQIIVPSKNLDRLIRRVFPKVSSTIIPNGINLNKFSSNGKRGNKILVVTRMFERKGVQYFLQALSEMGHDFQVNIVGDGPYLKTLKESAKNKNLKVNFKGFIDNNSKKLHELFESSRIFVFTSEAENFPVVLLEAMIAGLAIITTNDTGCAEVVGDSAILIPSKNPVEIKKALKKLISNPDLCDELGKSARERAERYFGWDSVSAKHINLYNQITGKQPEAQLINV